MSPAMDRTQTARSGVECTNNEATAPWPRPSKSFNFVWFINRSEIDVDLRTLVYYYGIANTGLEEWKWLFNKFMNTSEASEKSKLMYALAGSRETWILNMWDRMHFDVLDCRLSMWLSSVI